MLRKILISLIIYSFVVILIVCLINNNIIFNKKNDIDIMQNTVTISTVIIGFSLSTLAILIGSGDHYVIRRIKHLRLDDTFFTFFILPIITGAFHIISYMFLLLFSIQDIWVFSFFIVNVMVWCLSLTVQLWLFKEVFKTSN